MTPDEQTILKLTRETIELATKIKDLERERSGAEMHLAEADVPRGFEDGNSWDDYGFSERVGVLCGMYKRAVAERDVLRDTCAGWKKTDEETKHLLATVMGERDALRAEKSALLNVR